HYWLFQVHLARKNLAAASKDLERAMPLAKDKAALWRPTLLEARAYTLLQQAQAADKTEADKLVGEADDLGKELARLDAARGAVLRARLWQRKNARLTGEAKAAAQRELLGILEAGLPAKRMQDQPQAARLLVERASLHLGKDPPDLDAARKDAQDAL